MGATGGALAAIPEEPSSQQGPFDGSENHAGNGSHDNNLYLNSGDAVQDGSGTYQQHGPHLQAGTNCDQGTHRLTNSHPHPNSHPQTNNHPHTSNHSHPHTHQQPGFEQQPYHYEQPDHRTQPGAQNQPAFRAEVEELASLNTSHGLNNDTLDPSLHNPAGKSGILGQHPSPDGQLENHYSNQYPGPPDSHPDAGFPVLAQQPF